MGQRDTTVQVGVGPPDHADTTGIAADSTGSIPDTTRSPQDDRCCGHVTGKHGVFSKKGRVRRDTTESADTTGVVAGSANVRSPNYAALVSDRLLLPIAFGTDRRYNPTARPGNRFNSTPADDLSLGVVWVNVPSYQARRVGEVNTPPMWRVNRFYSFTNLQHDMFVDSMTVADSSAFYGNLAQWVRETRDSLLFVFIHGYNVTFEDAALRTAQLAADISFPGVPLFYSWASRGQSVGYIRDGANALNSADHLARFLSGVAGQHPGWKIQLIAHSMGSQVVTRALEELDRDSPSIHFGQVIFVAPDLDVRPFRRTGLHLIKRHSDRVTVYASNEDVALKASRALVGVWRLGLGGDSLVVLPDMDTIDATNVRTDWLGHGPFGSEGFLYDLAGLLNEGRGPPRQLLRVPRGQLAFWRFRPTSHR
jgi:esterase/lipase superfamily enzyme